MRNVKRSRKEVTRKGAQALDAGVVHKPPTLSRKHLSTKKGGLTNASCLHLETTRESLKEIFDADDNYWNALNGKVAEAAQNHDLGPGNKADCDEIDLYRKGYKRDKNFLFRPDIDFVKVAEITLKVVAILYVLYGPTIRRRDSIDGGENSGGPSGYGQFANYEGNIIRTAVNALHARRRSAYIPGYYLW
jgi:hypothetical protein